MTPSRRLIMIDSPPPPLPDRLRIGDRGQADCEGRAVEHLNGSSSQGSSGPIWLTNRIASST